MQLFNLKIKGEQIKMLSCVCSHAADDWYHNIPNHFIIYKKLQRKKCCSCGKIINFNNTCVEFHRYRDTRTDIEEKIRGNEVPLASWFMCEACGEIYLNLSALGFYVSIEEPMKDTLKEYWKLAGFEPIKEQKCKK